MPANLENSAVAPRLEKNSFHSNPEGKQCKGEKERYTNLNEEFQRIARGQKKAFLSEHCKETEGNNRMRKTRDLFKETGITKGTFHAKMDTVNDRKQQGHNRNRRD